MARIDLEISGGGSISLSHAVRAGLATHVPADALCRGDAVRVEWCYIGDVVGGAIGAGLRVQ